MDENVLLEEILYLSSRIAETRDLEPLLIYSVDVALDLFNAEHGFLILKKADDTLDFRIKRARHEHDVETPEISRQVLDTVLHEGKPITAANAVDDPAFKVSPSVKALNLRSVMCVPLIANNNIIGALYLDNRLTEGAFNETDLKYLQLFANQVAVSIENVKLTEELEAHIQERTAELDAYAHTVAHDLKSPISLILGFTAMLQEDWETLPADEIEERLRYIEQGCRKMTNIIDELLLFAKIRKQSEIPLQTLNMSILVLNAQIRLKTQANEASAEIDIPDTWPSSIGYAPWVEEVWVNLISNAIKYGGNPPYIELGAEDLPDIKQVRFWVSDRGAGIDPAHLGSLFTEFTRLDKQGTQGHGLGLSIVQRIIERLSGHVGVESEIGQGSTFWFTLPASE